LAETQLDGAEQWSTLSPWAVVYFSAHSIRQILTNGVTLAPIVVGLLQADGLLVPGIVIGSAIALIILHAWLSVRRFKYQLLDRRLKVRQGILQVAQIDLDFSRVQNVSIVSPFYFRPLGLVSLTIESAGSSEEEIILAALHEQHAEQIRQSIARSRAVASSHPSAQVTDEELLVTRETRDLFIHGISSNQAWLVVAGFIGAYSQMPDAWQLDSDAFVEVLPSGLLESSAVQMVLLGLALVLTGFALMLALSVIASLLIYGNFELRRVRDGFAARQGAISSKVLNMRQRRIQTVTVRQNWIARYFARFNLSLEQISHSQPGAETAGRLLIPAVTMTQSAELTTTALDGPPMLIAAESFSRVSSYYLRKRWLWLGAIYALAIIMISSSLSLWLLLPTSAIVLTIGLAQYRNWRLLGLAINGDFLTLRTGLIGRNYVVLPLYKVQRVTLVQSPFMVRRKVANVRLFLASRVVTLPCLPEALAREVANFTLCLVEEQPRSWM
jgi:putative membrane protein